LTTSSEEDSSESLSSIEDFTEKKPESIAEEDIKTAYHLSFHNIFGGGLSYGEKRRLEAIN
jgi:hypothetical protein